MSWKLLALIVLLWAAWDIGVGLVGIRQMPPWALKARLAEETPGPVLLDVRTPLEFRWFHIPGAINAPYPPRPEALGIPKDAEIVLLCMTGHRSPLAAYRLRSEGYANVANLTWGMSAYALLGGETVSGNGP